MYQGIMQDIKKCGLPSTLSNELYAMLAYMDFVESMYGVDGMSDLYYRTVR